MNSVHPATPRIHPTRAGMLEVCLADLEGLEAYQDLGKSMPNSSRWRLRSFRRSPMRRCACSAPTPVGKRGPAPIDLLLYPRSKVEERRHWHSHVIARAA